MPEDELFFGRALGRIGRWMAILVAAGTLAGFFLRGWEWSGGFLLGALASYWNFRWLNKLVNSLADAAQNRPAPGRSRMAIVLGLRYLLLGSGAYVIVNYSTLSLPAALLGLFVPVAAVVVEILFELVFA